MQSATEIKICVMLCPCWMSLDETITMFAETGMLSQTSGVNYTALPLIMHVTQE